MNLNKSKFYLKNKKLLQINYLELISAAAVLNKKSILKKLLISAKENNLKDTLIYESLLQTYLFAGIPSALISLKIFKEIFTDSKIYYKNNSKYAEAEGIKNCRKIYGEKYDKLILNVNSFSPELAEILVVDGYGKILGRKSLSLKNRELLIVSILTALKFENQLYSHINGAFRMKAKMNEIKDAIKILDLIDKKNRSKFGMKVLDKLIKNKG